MSKARKLMEQAGDMEHRSLSDILTPEQIQEVTNIANSVTDDMELTRKLKAYFATIAQELDAKGIVPDYLAYMLTHLIMQQHQAPQPPRRGYDPRWN